MRAKARSRRDGSRSDPDQHWHSSNCFESFWGPLSRPALAGYVNQHGQARPALGDFHDSLSPFIHQSHIEPLARPAVSRMPNRAFYSAASRRAGVVPDQRLCAAAIAPCAMMMLVRARTKIRTRAVAAAAAVMSVINIHITQGPNISCPLHLVCLMVIRYIL